MNHWILIIFPAAVIILSSLCSRAEDGEFNGTTIVCGTAKGKGSHANCTVPYNDIELVLSCASSEWVNHTDFRPVGVLWMKDNCSSKQILSRDQNYTVNDQGRRLTNDDSATYCCTWNSKPAEYRYVRVNVHAPPQLTNVYTCKGVDRSDCYVGEHKLQYSDSSIDIIASFTGYGPFSVQWYHNNTELKCQNSGLVCVTKNISNNIQKLTLQKSFIKDGWMINGDYTAVVSNPYGSNSSIYYIRYVCVSSFIEHQKNQTRTLDLTKGAKLDYSCELTGPNSFDVVVCLTRNKSDKIEQLLRNTPGDCMQFSNGVCTRKFNNSLTRIQVSMSEERSDYCFPRQLVNFVKNSVSLGDNGMIILSGFKVYDQKNIVIQYCSVRLRVRHSQIPVRVLVPVVAVVLIVITLVPVVAIVIKFYKQYYRGCFESREINSEDEHRALLRESDGEGQQSESDMQAMPRVGSEELPQNSDVGVQRISLLESLEGTIDPEDFPGVIEGSETQDV